MDEPITNNRAFYRRLSRLARRRRRRALVARRAVVLATLVALTYVGWRGVPAVVRAAAAPAQPAPASEAGPSPAEPPPAARALQEGAKPADPPKTQAPPENEHQVSGSASEDDLKRLRAVLGERLGAAAPHYGVFVIDLASGRGTGVNEDRFFPAASTVKLAVAMYVLDEAAGGRMNLDERIAYVPGDYEEGSGVLQAAIEAGDDLPVRELLRLSLSHSDNIATNMLLRRFGHRPVVEYAARLGVGLRFEPGVNEVSARGMALLMQRLMDRRRVGAAARAFILDALGRTDAEPRLGRGVPAGIAAPHKVGTLPGVVNDAALILLPGRPLAMAVLSENVDEEAAVQRLGRLAEAAVAWARR